MPNLYVALIHHPVVDKNGALITSAITNLDLHDIARASRTYGVRAFYVITPLTDQQRLVQRLTEHWVTGAGAHYNPQRGAALALIRLTHDLGSTITQVARETGHRPLTVATSARPVADQIGFDQLRAQIQSDTPHLLLLGTAWGLAPVYLQQADLRLAPIAGGTDYNHLSVRTAAAIILDRLLARDI
jgi:hypothetical protein